MLNLDKNRTNELIGSQTDQRFIASNAIIRHTPVAKKGSTSFTETRLKNRCLS